MAKFEVNGTIYFYTSTKVNCVCMLNVKGQAQICKFLGGKVILKKLSQVFKPNSCVTLPHVRNSLLFLYALEGAWLSG